MRMIGDPKVSVVLPCYNAHKYMPAALQSIERQSYKNIEIIVVDDGSTHRETIEYLGGIGNRVKLLRQNNLGLSAARNRGFQDASGDYILPLDCDDWLEPNAIEELVILLEQSEVGRFAFPQMILEGDLSGVTNKHFNFFEQLFLNQLPYCLMVPKAAWRDIGGYDEAMRDGYEDWDFNIRLGLSGWRGVSPVTPLFHYRVSKGGMLLSKSSRLHSVLWAVIREKNGPAYTLGNLYKMWSMWAAQPSTYPLLIYWIWLLANKVLPMTFNTWVFNLTRRWSHSRRVSRKHLR